MVFDLALLDFSSALAVGPRHTRLMKNSECLLCKGPFTQNAFLKYTLNTITGTPRNSYE